MWKVHISRWVNYHLLNGKQGQMISTRAYVEHRLSTQLTIDWMFFILRGEKNHCRNCLYLDKGVEYEAENETNKSDSA